MSSNRDANNQLLADIDSEFVSVIGPIGRILIEDARKLWKQKQWKGPSALRNYIKALAANLDNVSDQDKFVLVTNKIVFEAVSKQSGQ